MDKPYRQKGKRRKGARVRKKNHSVLRPPPPPPEENPPPPPDAALSGQSRDWKGCSAQDGADNPNGASPGNPRVQYDEPASRERCGASPEGADSMHAKPRVKDGADDPHAAIPEEPPVRYRESDQGERRGPKDAASMDASYTQETAESRLRRQGETRGERRRGTRWNNETRRVEAHVRYRVARAQIQNEIASPAGRRGDQRGRSPKLASMKHSARTEIEHTNCDSNARYQDKKQKKRGRKCGGGAARGHDRARRRRRAIQRGVSTACTYEYVESWQMRSIGGIGEGEVKKDIVKGASASAPRLAPSERDRKESDKNSGRRGKGARANRCDAHPRDATGPTARLRVCASSAEDADSEATRQHGTTRTNGQRRKSPGKRKNVVESASAPAPKLAPHDDERKIEPRANGQMRPNELGEGNKKAKGRQQEEKKIIKKKKITHDMPILPTLVARLGLRLRRAVARDVALEPAVVAAHADSSANVFYPAGKKGERTYQVGVPALGHAAAWWPTAASRHPAVQRHRVSRPFVSRKQPSPSDLSIVPVMSLQRHPARCCEQRIFVPADCRR
ncbi:hypothetical protein C8R47DRAFT_1068179 [Mycena vitilis]|nr:hypothetical protein C8R47DRAFT_1068179 [Mycena vitilis]